MSSLMEQAVSGVIEALAVVPGLPVPRRVNLRPTPQDSAQGIEIRPLEASPGEISMAGLPVSWANGIALECKARANAGQAPDQAVDGMLQSICAALMSNPTLGGVAVQTSIDRITWDFDTDADRTACATLFLIVVQSAGNSIF